MAGYKRIIFLVMCVALLQGCNTLKGAAKGAAQGAQQDFKDLKNVDGWMKENMW
jgi:predicted small secreted protein